jgi:hypothetical protein
MKLGLKKVEDTQLSIGCVVACANFIQTVVLKNTLVTVAHHVPKAVWRRSLTGGQTACIEHGAVHTHVVSDEIVTLHSTKLISSIDGSKPYNVHEDTSSTLDPGRHLTSLDMAGLLPFNFPWITSHTASYNILVSAKIQ